jgi:peptidyl-tRNA hydrolase
VAEEKRIYVVVAETVDAPIGVVTQVCGRIAAQCAHVVSKMQVHRVSSLDLQKVRLQLALEAIATLVELCTSIKLKRTHELEPCTTIVLAVKDSRELAHIAALLTEFGHQRFEFIDSNPDVYGDGGAIRTAVCTLPVYKAEVELIFGGLHCWEHGVNEVLPATFEHPFSFWDTQEQQLMSPFEGQV